MSEEYDPFDIANLTLSPEDTARIVAARAERDAIRHAANKPQWLTDKIAASRGGGKKPKRNDLFVQISHKAIAAGSGVLTGEQWWPVWLYIHFRVFWDKSSTVEIGNKTLKEWGVTRWVKTRALRALKGGGLISIEWRGRKSPLVTVRSDLLRP